MSYRRFFLYNVVGALVWVGLFLAAGYLFGNLPFVKRNFSKVILAIIVVSVLPIVWEWWKHRRASARAKA
jgi:membrane-associated protein